MRVTPEHPPTTLPILAPTFFKGPVIKGNRPLTYMCGSCGLTLLRYVVYKQVEYKRVQGVVIKCVGCGSFSEIPSAHHRN
jgi:hypothetical protein